MPYPSPGFNEILDVVARIFLTFLSFYQIHRVSFLVFYIPLEEHLDLTRHDGAGGQETFGFQTLFLFLSIGSPSVEETEENRSLASQN